MQSEDAMLIEKFYCQFPSLRHDGGVRMPRPQMRACSHIPLAEDRGLEEARAFLGRAGGGACAGTYLRAGHAAVLESCQPRCLRDARGCELAGAWVC